MGFARKPWLRSGLSLEAADLRVHSLGQELLQWHGLALLSMVPHVHPGGNGLPLYNSIRCALAPMCSCRRSDTAVMHRTILSECLAFRTGSFRACVSIRKHGVPTAALQC